VLIAANQGKATEAARDIGIYYFMHTSSDNKTTALRDQQVFSRDAWTLGVSQLERAIIENS
jgi:hypothetical protein